MFHKLCGELSGKNGMIRIFTAAVFLAASCGSLSYGEDAADRPIFKAEEIAEFVRNDSGDAIHGEFEIDINDDAMPDRFIGVQCGNAGCRYYCFLSLKGNHFRFIGKLGIHSMGFEVLKSKHNGISDILAYWRLGGNEGKLIRYEYDGKDFVERAFATGSSRLFDMIEPGKTVAPKGAAE